MPNSLRPHFVFIDFENKPDVDLRRLNGLGVKVILLIGKQQPNASAKLVASLAEVGFEVRLLKMGVIKKNALDFALAFHLGECVARYPHGRFFIVSADKKDFGPLVTHLLAHHVDVSRHDDLDALLPQLPGPTGPKKVTSLAVNAAPAKVKPAPKPKITALPPAVAVARPPLDRIAKIITACAPRTPSIAPAPRRS